MESTNILSWIKSKILSVNPYLLKLKLGYFLLYAGKFAYNHSNNSITGAKCIIN